MKNEQGLYNSNIIIEVISVRGLQLENHTYLRNLKLHIIFDNQVLQSNEIDFTPGNEVVIDFKACFKIMSNTMEVKQESRPIFIFLSQSLSHNVTDGLNNNTIINASNLLDHQPVGITFSRTLLAEAVVDSRLAFLHANEFLSVELVPCNCGGIIDVGFCGVLFMKFSLLGPLSQWINKTNIDEEAKLNDIEEMKVNIEKNQKAIEKLNYEQYQVIKTWYSKCRATHPYIEDRRIKLIALDECGRHRMVCNFIGRITPPRMMDGPRHTARFVSLIPFYRSLELIGGNISSWNSSYITLSKLQGDIEDHAILLCSLLLGWGMDAWIAYGSIFTPVSTIGSSANTGSGSGGSGGGGIDMIPTNHFHYWVVTLDGLKSTNAANISSTSGSNSSRSKLNSDDYIIFWEPLTGQQYKVPVNNKTYHHTVIRRYNKKISKSSSSFIASSITTTAKKHNSSVNSTVGKNNNNDNKNIDDDTVINSSNSNYHPFRFIYSLFRNDYYLINLQQSPNVCEDVDDSVPMASFDINNDKFWSRLSNPHYEALKHPGASIPLPYHREDTIYHPQKTAIVAAGGGGGDGRYHQSLNNNNKAGMIHHSSTIPYIRSVCINDLEIGIERAIQRECMALRSDKGLQTMFDDTLSIILQVS
jgi:hypothetical protein